MCVNTAHIYIWTVFNAFLIRISLSKVDFYKGFVYLYDGDILDPRTRIDFVSETTPTTGDCFL